MTTNNSENTERDFNPEDVPYWAYVVSRLPSTDNVFWNFVKLQEEQMAILQVMISLGQLSGAVFVRND